MILSLVWPAMKSSSVYGVCGGVIICGESRECGEPGVFPTGFLTLIDASAGEASITSPYTSPLKLWKRLKSPLLSREEAVAMSC